MPEPREPPRTGPRMPDYTETSRKRIEEAVGSAISEADGLIARAVPRADSLRAMLEGLDAAERLVEAATTPFVALAIIHPDPDIREAAGEADKRVARWRLDVVRRHEVADAILRFEDVRDGPDLPEYAAALRAWQRDVRLAGGGLGPAERDELRDIEERLAGIGSRFDAHVTDADVRLLLSEDDVRGVPAAFLETLPRDADGRYDIRIDNSTAITLLETAERRDIRERVDRAFLTRAADSNADLIAEAITLRSRQARLLGYDTWLDLRAESLVAGGRTTIERFLADIEPPLRTAAGMERDELAMDLEAELGERVAVEDWDWRYLDARQRARLGIDQDELREYLPLDAVLEGLFALTEDVFGVRVEAGDGGGAWHADVRRLELSDAGTGELLDVCLLDPYARDGKLPNAFMWILIPGRSTPHGREPGLSTLVTSLPRPTKGRAALLGVDDVDALFHEFGHVLDFALGTSRLLPRPTWLLKDWAEAPSQFLGRWALHPEVLRRYARHYRTGAEIPGAIARGLQASLDLNAATHGLRLLSLAKLDVAFHTARPDTTVDVPRVDREAFETRGFAAVPGALFAAAFGHPWAGYDGACYGFLWAQVLLAEIFDAFAEAGPTSATVGAAYRREILELGWWEDPVAGLTRFLRRAPADRAYLRRLGVPPPGGSRPSPS